MSFSVGIVGLPNAGKSTLFKALTKNPVEIASYPFTTIDPNIGRVAVPDQALEEIAQIIKPQKTTPTIIEFTDIAGLVKNAHKGEGLGNQFLAQIRNCDAILEIVRTFRGNQIEHVEKDINPQRDIEIIKNELISKDLETIEKILSKLEKETRDKGIIRKFELLRKIKENLLEKKTILETDLTTEEKLEVKEYQFLTAKPILRIINTDNNKGELEINLKDEEEFSNLAKEERKELGFQSQLDKLIVSCYNLLDLITFYTLTGGKEVRAWTIKKGEGCQKAAGQVHSDFEEKFIRAEVIPSQKLIEIGGWTKARELGLLKTVGKEYIVQDKDIIEFKI